MRIMAIDLGDQRTGLAVSDLTATLCGEAWTVKEWDLSRLAETITQEAKKREVGKLVLGLPKNMDGTEGERCAICRDFAAVLEEKSGLPVTLWDERRSSIDAHQILRANGKKEIKHRSVVDAVAASIILEGFLNSSLNTK